VDQDTPVTGGSLKVTVGTATAKAGDTVELPIRITENSGFSYIRIRVKTSLAYTLRNGSVMSMTQGSSVIWHLDRDATGSFDLAYLVLQIPEDAEDGDTFTVELDVAESNNMDEETLTCTAVHGKVTIKNAIPGDANGDNTVSGKDLTRLLRFIADYDESTGKSSVDIDFAAADLNQDSKLSGIDVTRLLKILANQD
jgi:hypothetical protein